MNKANKRGLLATGVLAACLIGTPAIGQQVTNPNPTPPAGVTDTTRTHDDRPDFGWIGLLGLVGLAGLMRRTRPENLGSARTAAAAR
jgi:MYXO-CTERM domain-containing protein